MITSSRCFPRSNAEAFEPFFSNLPVDPYIQGNFRRRRFSRFTGTPGNLHRLEHKYFVQSTKVNQLAGGIKRDFPELEDSLLELEAFQTVVASFIDFSKIDPMVTEMGIHQIRIVASRTKRANRLPRASIRMASISSGIFCIKRDATFPVAKPTFTAPRTSRRCSIKCSCRASS